MLDADDQGPALAQHIAKNLLIFLQRVQSTGIYLNGTAYTNP